MLGYDTTTGDQLRRTGVGNGSVDDSNLADLYADPTPVFRLRQVGRVRLTASAEVYR